MTTKIRIRGTTANALAMKKSLAKAKRGAKKMKKSVRFSSVVARQAATNITTSQDPDGTASNDTQDSWYARQDYDSMRHGCKMDVVAFAMALKSGTSSQFDGTRIRGLEQYFPPTKKSILSQRKKQRVQAVLGYQLQLQSSLKSSAGETADSLAFFARMLSKKACERAVEMGRRDAMVWGLND